MAIGVFAYFQYAPVESNVSVTDAKAVPIGSDGATFIVSLRLDNAGPPVALTVARSQSDADVHMMNPSNPGNSLVIPGGTHGLLAMDGAHIMMSNPSADFSEGAFQSIALTFDDGSEVTARVIHAGAHEDVGAMNHGAGHGMEASPTPTIQIVPPTTPNVDGFKVQLTFDNIELVAAPDGAAHIDGQGHAHIYLNGLKLGRLYEDNFELGSLQPGNYALRIALNTNDHRPYVAFGQPIETELEFRIPE